LGRDGFVVVAAVELPVLIERDDHAAGIVSGAGRGGTERLVVSASHDARRTGDGGLDLGWHLTLLFAQHG
jgi:hypothetical protein